MIITCPACSKRYLVDDSAIDESGRRVQCISCQHDWLFKPTPESKDLEQVHLDLIGTAASKNTKNSINLGWVLFVITLIALGFGVVMGQSVIEEKLPFTKPIYNLVGLSHNQDTDGLSFQDLRPLAETSEKGQQLKLTGVIANTTKDVKGVKSLTLTVKGDCQYVSWFHRFFTTTVKGKDSNQCVLESWVYEPSESKIYPGERVTFETASSKTLKGAQSIQVQF